MALKNWLFSRLALRIYLVGLLQIVAVTAGFLVLVQVVRDRYVDPVALEGRFVEDTVAPLIDDPGRLAAAIDAARPRLQARITVIDPRGQIIASNAAPDAAPCDGGGPHDGGPTHGGRPPPHDHPDDGHPDGPPDDGPRHRHDPHDHAPPGTRPPPSERVTAVDWWPFTSGEPEKAPAPGLCRSASLRFADGTFGRVEFRRDTYPSVPGVPGLAVIALVLVVVFVGSSVLVRSIGKPLERLATTARAFGAGAFDARSGLARRDEIGAVATAFDEMADHVADLVRGEKELIANVSHELRTPLARIRVALDLATEGGAEMAKASLADIAEDLDELERLISDVLTAARLDLGKGTSSGGIPPLRRERVAIAGLIDHAASRFRASHPDRALAVEVAAHPPDVDGDPVLLRRVVDNLLENAHKYTEDPGAGIEVRVVADDGVVIEVKDRGIGIAAADLSGVFRPFFRVDRSRTRETGGLGLGLALARRIVEAHQGTITLRSTPGEGTCAVVRLPAAPPEDNALSEPSDQNETVSAPDDGPTESVTR